MTKTKPTKTLAVSPFANRTASGLYEFSTRYPKCFYCNCALRGRLTTGILPKVGVVWKCGECQTLYNEAREAQ